jgi:hypothetical protein
MEYRKQFGEGIVGRTEFHQLCEDDPDWRQCAIFERPDGNSAGLKGDNLVAVVNERIADTVIAALRAGGSPRVLTCVYCGQHQALFEHIGTCPKHPLGQAIRVVQMLYARLLQIDTEMPHGASLAAVDFLENIKPPASPAQGNDDKEPEDLWAEDSVHPRSSWQHEVANGETQRGYWDWVKAKREEDQEDLRRHDALGLND